MNQKTEYVQNLEPIKISVKTDDSFTTDTPL